MKRPFVLRMILARWNRGGGKKTRNIETGHAFFAFRKLWCEMAAVEAHRLDAQLARFGCSESCYFLTRESERPEISPS